MESLVKESKVMVAFVTHMPVLVWSLCPPIQEQLQEGYGLQEVYIEQDEVKKYST